MSGSLRPVRSTIADTRTLPSSRDRTAPPVVFSILRDSQCSECGAELWKGSFLRIEAEQPLCLSCAHLDDLEYLPAGDTALTRRTTKYSQRIAVVVRFSRSRGRYERHGILAETSALERAEQECSKDAAERARNRVADLARRKAEDRILTDHMTERINRLFPGCPAAEASAIAAYTAVRGSGRVGRTAAGRQLEESSLTAAVIAGIRHRCTPYDSLLASGLDRSLAREQVRDQIHAILATWRR